MPKDASLVPSAGAQPAPGSDAAGEPTPDAGPRSMSAASGGASSDAVDAAAPAASAATPDRTDAGVSSRPLRAYVFSRTAQYRHAAIEPAREALADMGSQLRAELAFGEDPAQLVAALADTDVVVFLMTTGDVLDDDQQAAFESYIRTGGGFLGIHSAADTEYDWPFYQTLNGAWFDGHPAIQPARLNVEAVDHPAVSFLPAIWERTDEWYNFRSNPRGAVDVLVTLDESSYDGGTHGSDHPVIWCHRIDAGRAFYSALGHTEESWQEPLFLQHIERALLWAAGR